MRARATARGPLRWALVGCSPGRHLRTRGPVRLPRRGRRGVLVGLTLARLGWAFMVLVVGAVATYLRRLSLSSPSLLPAARAVAAFALLDGVRLAIDVAGRPGWLAWADVVAFVMMPGCWAGLLMRGKDERPGVASPEPLPADPDVTPGAPELKRSALSPALGCSELRRAEPMARRPVAQAVPVLALLAYASLLLALRHQPAVAAHWLPLLQAPRLVVGAWALWVAMRGKTKGPEAEAHEPFCAPSRPTCERTQSEPGGYLAPNSRIARSAQPTPARRLAQPLPPSTAIGIALALSAAASVVGGLWLGPWAQTWPVSAAGWLAAVVVARQQKSTGG